MNKPETSFKKGDKVVCTIQPFFGGIIEDIDGEYLTLVGFPCCDFLIKEFELIKESKEMFDIQKDKWYIRVNSVKEAEAVQDWAFAQGFSWAGRTSYRDDFDDWDSPEKAIGFGHSYTGTLGQATAIFWVQRGHKEIKMTFKTSIDEVVLPEVESPQQKRIKELEQTIAQASQQIAALKEEI